ncbi:MAG: hypothetical protein WC705_01740 [Candidatus Paceibacterota bacterium]|jgi:hypothetical protein
MNLNKIQEFAKKILRNSTKTKNSLSSLAKDNCSELTRLVGCFILKSQSGVTVYVLKGDRVFGKKQSHDILALHDKNGVFVIDPSVWQFFPNKKSILISNSKNIKDAIKSAEKIYGGKWKVSEKLSLKKCLKNQKKWISVIRKNNQK